MSSRHANMLQRGDHTPHFQVTTLDGRTVSYSTIWQRRNLVLLMLRSEDVEAAENYVRQLAPSRWESDTACVVTRQPVEGLTEPSVLVADRWGEIVFVAAAASVEELPSADEVSDWLDYLRKQCPECEGEAR